MARWTMQVSIGGIDVSHRITSEVVIEAEESASRIASFTMKPAEGIVVDIGDWLGSPVEIDYVYDPEGSPSITRIFTGIINWPDYNPVTRLVRFDATDNLQGHFESKTEAEILTAISGGKYATAVFGEREDGWQQAMDVLSTVPKSYDLNRDGVTPILADWAAGSADYSYDEADIIDGEVSLELARFRDLVNRVAIKYQYRYTRLHHREHTFGWNWGVTGFCEWYSDTFELPNRDMINSAANDAGWKIKGGGGGFSVGEGGIYFQTLPPSGTYNCNGQVLWSISEELMDQLVVNASWTAVKRWTQTITESYEIVVEDASSISKYGLSYYEDGAGSQEDYDDAQWDASTGSDTPVWPQDAIGDYVYDVLDRADSDNTIETLLQMASVKILASHRNNLLGCTVLIEPTLERWHTVSIDAGNVAGTGKIFSYIHRLDTANGSATTTLKIAISKSDVVGASDALTAPIPPSTEPTHAAPASGTVLPTRIGNDDTADDYSEAWTGYTGNYSVAHGSPSEAQIYPRRIRIDTPEIEDEARNEIEATATATYNVQCPNEYLVIYG